MPLIAYPASGFPNASLTYSATTDRAVTAGTNLDELTKFSILLLVKPTTLTTARRIFCKRAAGGGVGWFLGFSSTDANNLRCFQNRTGTDQSYITSTVHLVVNRWTWIAVARDQSWPAGGLWKLYSSDLNSGAWKTAAWGTATDGTNPYDADAVADLHLGNEGNTNNTAFQGSIAFAALYRDALRLNEFNDMVRTGNFQKDRALGMWYPGTHATNVFDVTGNGNTLAITGAVLGASPIAHLGTNRSIWVNASAAPPSGNRRRRFFMAA